MSRCHSTGFKKAGKACLGCWIVLLCVFAGASVGARTTAGGQREALKAVAQTGQPAQGEADPWAMERDGLLAEIGELKARLDWLQHQRAKYQVYLERQQEAIPELERQKERRTALKLFVEPFLDHVVKRLESYIQQDLPFLAEERAQRIAFLKGSLNDYHLSPAEKFRRVMEALRVEAEYSKSIETTEESLELNGESVQVQVFRLGRIALFYRSLDGKRAGILSRTTGEWKALPERWVQPVTRAMEMAERRRAYDLVDLPVGRLEP